MKHSSAFISYLCYMALYLNALCECDNEKIGYYMEEMNNLDKMNTDEILELLNYMFIMASIFSNRQ